MKNWRNEILKHFSEPIPALTIVADPDELLCDESIKETWTKDVVLDVPSPFADGDIRSMVDNLFVEGKLRPVKIGSRSLRLVKSCLPMPLRSASA